MTLWEAIKNALIECINTHGPITKEFIGSAAKRIVMNIMENRPNDGTVLDKMIVDTMQTLITAEKNALRKDVIELRNTVKDLRIKDKEQKQKIQIFEEKFEGCEKRFRKSQEDKANCLRELQKAKKTIRKLMDRIPKKTLTE